MVASHRAGRFRRRHQRPAETYASCFELRGYRPRKRLELTLGDPSGRMVWWYRQGAVGS